MKSIAETQSTKKGSVSDRVLNLPLYSGSLESLLARLYRHFEPSASPATVHAPLVVFTPNPEQIVMAADDASFHTVLTTADILIPDGWGLVLAAQLLGTKVKQRITGIDLAEKLIAHAVEADFPVLLVGGQATTAKLAAERLSRRFSGLCIAGLTGPVDALHEDPTEWAEVKRVITKLKPKLLIVGFGAPKQERWVAAHRHELGVPVVLVAGGAIDVWAGVVKRAPQLLQASGLEWLWRLVNEPWRWRRQLRLTRFVKMVIGACCARR